MSDARYKFASAFAALLVIASAIALPVAPAGAIPAGLVTIPDSNVSDDFAVGADPGLRAADLEGSVMVSSHAETTEVIVTTPDRASEYLDNGTVVGSGEIAIVIRDDVNAGGRTVALDSRAVKDALGYAPERVYGTHDDGSSWSSEVSYEAGTLSFDVPHFSTNTVTFSGSVKLTATPASDGTTLSYTMSDVDSVSDFEINVTGSTTSETDTDSGTFSSSGGSGSISLAGNLEPTGPAGGEPELSVSGDVVEDSNSGFTSHDTDIDAYGTRDSEFQVTGLQPMTISKIRVNQKGTGGSGAGVDIYIVEGESPDLNFGEGTKVKDSWNPPDSTGWTTIDVSDTSVSSSTITVEFVSVTESSGDFQISSSFDDGSSASTNRLSGGSEVGPMDYQGDIEFVGPSPTSVSVSTGTGITKNFGDIGSGSASTPIDLTGSETSLSASYSGGGSISWDLQYTERTETTNPQIEVNGNTATYSGTLSDGQTESLSTDLSWITSGENQVNVTVGSSLSSDAPTPSVDLEYSHDASTEQTVEYTSEKWVESYNVSKTFASDQEGTTVSIPFDGRVIEIESVETRLNGGSWSEVSSSSVSLDNTTLTVETGDVTSGDTLEVRATGQKVVSINSTITVMEPTTTGNRLDTRIRLDSWASDSYLSLGGTPDAERVHYTYNETWSDSDPYTEITANGYNRLYLPGAAAGSELSVSTIPVRVNAKTGDVDLKIRDPQQTEPELVVKPGASSGDEIEYTYLTASTGSTYILWSHTNEIVRDSGTASSPVTLVDDDSNEILQFQLDDDGSSSTGGAAEEFTGIVSGGAKATPGNALFIAFAGAALAAVWFLSREFGSGAISTRMLFIGEAALIGVLAIETLSPASFVAGIAEAIVSFASEAGAGVATAMPLALLVIGGIVIYWLRSRSQPSKVVNFRLGGGRE